MYQTTATYVADAAIFNPGSQCTHINDLIVSIDEVLKQLLALDPRKCAEPNGLPNIYSVNPLAVVSFHHTGNYHT